MIMPKAFIWGFLLLLPSIFCYFFFSCSPRIFLHKSLKAFKVCRMKRWHRQCYYHQDLTASSISPKNLLQLLKNVLLMKNLIVAKMNIKMMAVMKKITQSQAVTWRQEKHCHLFMAIFLREWYLSPWRTWIHIISIKK